jgi:hypothetical protein
MSQQLALNPRIYICEQPPMAHPVQNDKNRTYLGRLSVCLSAVAGAYGLSSLMYSGSDMPVEILFTIPIGAFLGAVTCRGFVLAASRQFLRAGCLCLCSAIIVALLYVPDALWRPSLHDVLKLLSPATPLLIWLLLLALLGLFFLLTHWQEKDTTA